MEIRNNMEKIKDNLAYHYCIQALNITKDQSPILIKFQAANIWVVLARNFHLVHSGCYRLDSLYLICHFTALMGLVTRRKLLFENKYLIIYLKTWQVDFFLPCFLDFRKNRGRKSPENKISLLRQRDSEIFQ